VVISLWPNPCPHENWQMAIRNRKCSLKCFKLLIWSCVCLNFKVYCSNVPIQKPQTANKLKKKHDFFTMFSTFMNYKKGSWLSKKLLTFCLENLPNLSVTIAICIYWYHHVHGYEHLRMFLVIEIWNALRIGLCRYNHKPICTVFLQYDTVRLSVSRRIDTKGSNSN